MLSVQEIRRLRREELYTEQNAPDPMSHEAKIRRELLDRILGEDIAIKGGRA